MLFRSGHDTPGVAARRHDIGVLHEQAAVDGPHVETRADRRSALDHPQVRLGGEDLAGGRLDGVQIMLNRKHLYIGHQFTDGFSVMDASDPRNIKPAKYVLTGPNTSTHHLQVAEDYLLVAEGANVMAMQSYDDARSYFENTLADSITNRKKFRSGLSIHDISRPGEMREIAFLEMPGLGVNRLWWAGGRYAAVSAHFDGFTDHFLCMVDLQNSGLKYTPSMLWIDDIDVQAKWYLKLKREWAKSREEKRDFVNPIEPAILKWMS